MELLDVILVAASEASEAAEALDDLLDLLVLDLLAPRARFEKEERGWRDATHDETYYE